MAYCLETAGFAPVNTVNLCRISFISKVCCQQSYTRFASCAKSKGYEKVCHHNNKISKVVFSLTVRVCKGRGREREGKSLTNLPSAAFPLIAVQGQESEPSSALFSVTLSAFVSLPLHLSSFFLLQLQRFLAACWISTLASLAVLVQYWPHLLE